MNPVLTVMNDTVRCRRLCARDWINIVANNCSEVHTLPIARLTRRDIVRGLSTSSVVVYKLLRIRVVNSLRPGIKLL